MPAAAEDPGSGRDGATGSSSPAENADQANPAAAAADDAGASSPGNGAEPGNGDTGGGRDVQDPGRSLWRGLISLAILVALVVSLLLAVPGLHGVADRVSDMKLGWLLVAIALEVLSCVGYIIAFLQVFPRAPVRFGARVALSELAFGAAVSLGGAGSLAVGAWLLVERGGNPKRVAERSAVLFLLTSAINVLTLAIAGLGLFLGIFEGPSNWLLSLVPGLVGVVVFVLFLMLPRCSDRIAKRRRPGRVRTLLLEVSASIRQTEAVLFRRDWRIIGAIAYLWCDIGVLIACFAAAGHSPPVAAVVLAYQIGYLSNIIPVPGNIGVLDGSIVGLLVLYGVSATESTAATVVYHGISLWVPAMWGTIAFLILRRTRKEPLRLRPVHEARPERAQVGRTS